MTKSFTLIETIIVIAIATIIAGSVYGVIISLQPSIKLKSVTRDLTTDLRYSQQQAVTEQINFGVTILSELKQYQIVKYGATTEILLTKSLPVDIAFYEIIGFTNDEIIFNPYGAVLEMGTISLINSEQETKIIEIRPSGFVKIQ